MNRKAHVKLSKESAEVQRGNVRTARKHYCAALSCGTRGVRSRQGRLQGLWKPDPDVMPQQLADALYHLEDHPDAELIKEEPRIRVYRVPLFGRDVLVKAYFLISVTDRLKYLLRPSRARRFWAAACTLRSLHIHTPEPYGFLEVSRNGWPMRSYVLTAFMADAVCARSWIEPEYHLQPRALRTSIRLQLEQMLLTLYQYGIYHRDTKTANMLLHDPTNNSRRTFLWIDLECVQTGVIPTRHRIIRNLVQLNGSLGEQVSTADRYAFLRDLSQIYPWLNTPASINKIRRWTERRLWKERILGCGS